MRTDVHRRDKTNYYLDLAETVSQRCTCLRRHYGAVIVKNDEVISTGYVGAPRGRKNCTDLGTCVRQELHIPRGERYELCRSVHAEANAIISAPRDKMIDSTLYLVGKEVEIDAVCDGKEVFLPGIMELVERTGVHSGDSTSVYPPFSISEKVKKTIADYTVRLGLGIGIVGLYNIQFIVDKEDNVFVIEVNPRASRSVPFLSKSTGFPLVQIATRVMLGESLREQGITELNPAEKQRWYVKAPAFSFEKLSGMDAYLSPEMKSTGEAIGYDDKLNRALYKALQASGVKMKDYGTVVVTLADEDKEEALPLVRRFYRLGFNIEATAGTAHFLKQHGIRTRLRGKLSEGSTEILDSIRAGYVSYILNTRAIFSGTHFVDGAAIRRCAVQNGVTMFTSLDTVRILLDALEETVPQISTIDGQ